MVTAEVGVMNGSLLALNWKRHHALGIPDCGCPRKHSGCPESRPHNQAKEFQDEFFDLHVHSLERIFSVGSIMSAPLVSGGTVYIGSTDGNVYALE